MSKTLGVRWATMACLALVYASAAASSGQRNDNNPKEPKAPESKRPKLMLRAQPDLGIAPMRVVLTADLAGGSDDFEEYYCPSTVWEWGDGSASESSADCEPYQSGKSQIKRRFIVEHTYKRSGTIRVYFSLRHRDKEVAATGVNITVQPGGKDNSN